MRLEIFGEFLPEVSVGFLPEEGLWIFIQEESW